ncbi:hypothetical protein OGATHE_006657 [Ogataea polymorpha]|uniref:Uncharacterized protein n=1 Tax=Ogataea polymorpha TaxID=460523 RepID=A0A9P8NTH2_9ASCO|nr:hypothetical protein OGATHE_006657 [Ogataea polymorpha]
MQDASKTRKQPMMMEDAVRVSRAAEALDVAPVTEDEDTRVLPDTKASDCCSSSLTPRYTEAALFMRCLTNLSFISPASSSTAEGLVSLEGSPCPYTIIMTEPVIMKVIKQSFKVTFSSLRRKPQKSVKMSTAEDLSIVYSEMVIYFKEEFPRPISPAEASAHGRILVIYTFGLMK